MDTINQTLKALDDSFEGRKEVMALIEAVKALGRGYECWEANAEINAAIERLSQRAGFFFEDITSYSNAKLIAYLEFKLCGPF